MDRVDAMRVFARIVERACFSGTALDLGMPRSTVTQGIKELEARLGVRLLQRTTRHVWTTLDGRRIATLDTGTFASPAYLERFGTPETQDGIGISREHTTGA